MPFRNHVSPAMRFTPSKLTIGRKLELIGAIFVLPLAFLAYSVIAEKNIAIEFARREISGNHFLTAVTSAQMGLQRVVAARLDASSDGGAASTNALATVDRIGDVAKQYPDVPVDPALVDAAMASARGLLRAPAALGAEALTRQHDETLAAMRDLIAQVGDQSNLILDPDLDSYYTMYVVVVMLPELTDRLADLGILTAAIGAKGSLSVEDRAQFLIRMGQFEAARDEMVKAVEAAYRGNPDGRLKAGLDADYRAAIAALTDASTGLKGLVLQQGSDGRGAAALRDAGLGAIERVTRTAAAELDRLLQARIDGFESRLWWTLSLAAGIASLAVLLAALIGRGISRSLTRMSSTMTQLAASHLDVAIPGLGRRDEVGAMANAAQVFKDNAIENRRLVEERARQAQELRVSEQKFRSLIGNIPGACYRCANDAVYTIEFMSDAIEGLTGYPATDFIGNRVRAYSGLIHSDDWAAVSEATSAAVAEKRPYAIDYRLVHRDGSIRWVHDKGQGQFEDGVLKHLDGAVFDVTAHRHLEQELAHKEQLATIGTVAATVSHELRNPLAVIRSSLGTVQRLAGGGAIIDRALARADRNIVRCAGIIYDLLEYSQPRELARVTTDLDGWLRRVLSIQALPAGIRLATDLTAGSAVSIDAKAFAQVIDRLFENAVEALTAPTWTPEPGQPRAITVATALAGPHVLLTIADTAQGIPAEVLARVFEPMFTTRNFGVGLGLPIARQIVGLHGGTIGVESAAGRGTTVTIRLPRQTQRSAPPLANDESRLAGSAA
ncbi:MAG TPA: ATP-binding protein [Methylomirabilota bacterium]|nr:ATP-binding protein [Methylomirabilota bacterium]